MNPTEVAITVLDTYGKKLSTNNWVISTANFELACAAYLKARNKEQNKALLDIINSTESMVEFDTLFRNSRKK